MHRAGQEIRRTAWKESIKLIPLIVADTFTFVPKKVVNLFSKKKDEKPEIKQIEG